RHTRWPRDWSSDVCSSDLGDTAGFSMHPLKPLHVWGDGGAVTTSDDRAGEWLRLYRNHGMTGRDEVVMWGINQRLQTVQAVVARSEERRVGKECRAQRWRA